MADITSTYQLPNYYPAGGELFTEAEADDAIIVYTKKVSFNSVFNHWEMQVKDSSGNTYTWKDFVTAESAIKAAVKASIKTHLTTNVFKVMEDANNDGYLKSVATPADRGADEYLGD
ncbi:hypothetical protein N8529_00105 [bacterium]|nr:hypothetical protein [bacterium]